MAFNNKVALIKEARELGIHGLKEAKDFVEKVEADVLSSTSPSSSAESHSSLQRRVRELEENCNLRYNQVMELRKELSEARWRLHMVRVAVQQQGPMGD